MRSTLATPVLLLLSAVAVGTGVAAVLSNLVTFRSPPPLPPAAIPTSAGTRAGALTFAPPRPEDAPGEQKEAVAYGHRIMTETKAAVPAHVGNALACTNCHFEGGRSREGLTLVGVAAVYPKYRTRSRYSTDLSSRINECFERSMNGTKLPVEGKEMQALLAYLAWISRDVPVYGAVPWLGIQRIQSDRKPDPQRGATVYARTCASCHGAGGGGTLVAPPLWGEGSYNDGAGMSHVPNLAAFSRSWMPRTAPTLDDADALDVAAFVNSRPRPRFAAKTAR